MKSVERQFETDKTSALEPVFGFPMACGFIRCMATVTE